MKEQQKKKAAPVLVVLILIVIVGAAGVVSFLINRYKPGTEYMAGNEYFNLTDENSVALIQNGELLEEQAVLIGCLLYTSNHCRIRQNRRLPSILNP